MDTHVTEFECAAVVCLSRSLRTCAGFPRFLFLSPSIEDQFVMMTNFFPCSSVLNSVDPKYMDPTFTFFAAVKESTILFDFFEKAANEFIVPLVA